MRRHLAKKGAKTMAAVIALPQPAAVGGTPADITTVIKNTLDARERMYALHAMLIALRRTALDAFLSAFCADLAALTTEPDKAFVDSEYTKFNAWKAADDELGKRIEAVENIARYLRNRVAEFEKAYRDEVIALLEGWIAALRAQLEKEESDEGALYRRIDALNDELQRIAAHLSTKTTAKKTASKRAATKKATKRAAKKAGAKRAAKKAAKKI